MTLCDWMYESNTEYTFQNLDNISNADMDEPSEIAGYEVRKRLKHGGYII